MPDSPHTRACNTLEQLPAAPQAAESAHLLLRLCRLLLHSRHAIGPVRLAAIGQLLLRAGDHCAGLHSERMGLDLRLSPGQYLSSPTAAQCTN